MSCILYRKEHVKSGLIHPNGKIIALLVSSNISTIELYRFEDSKKPIKLIWSYQLKSESNSLCWYNDNKYICIGDSDGTVTVIDINGIVKSYNLLHNQFSEIIDLKCLTLNKEYLKFGKEGIYPRNLMEFVNIEPYALSARYYNSIDTFTSLGEEIQNSAIEVDSINNAGILNIDNYVNSLNSDLLNPGYNSFQDDIQNSNYKGCPKILPEFSNINDNISLLLSIDTSNNIICSIGGHTPIWVYKIDKLNDGKTNKLLSTNVIKNYILLFYKNLEETDLYCEIIDIRQFIESFDIIFCTFGYLQYMRQLLNYLKCVFRQVNLIWKTGIKPFRQLINNEKIIKKDDFSIFLNSILSGIPVNMFLTKNTNLSELCITIDQLVMIGQNIDDSVTYIKNVLSRTILPVMKHISIIWNITKKTNVIKDIDICNINDNIKNLEEFLKFFDDEIKMINPIIHTFLHLLSIIKTYKDDMKKATVDDLSPPKIIFSNNSNIISNTFNINASYYYILKNFIKRKNLSFKTEDKDKMQDEKLINFFFDALEFKNIDEFLNEDHEKSIVYISRLNSHLDELYKLTVKKITDNYINNFIDLKIKLNSEIFSNLEVNNNINVTVDNNIIIIYLVNILNFIQSQYVFTKIKILDDQNYQLEKKYELNSFDQDSVPDVIIEYRSKIYSPNLNISVSNSLVSLPNYLVHYNILNMKWTSSYEILILFNNNNSSLLFNFNLELLKFQVLNKIKNLEESFSINNYSQNSFIYYFYINNKVEASDPAKSVNILPTNCNLSNVYHFTQDISRIHRPQKFRNISINTDQSEDTDDINNIKNSHVSRTEIIDFYSQNNKVSLKLFFFKFLFNFLETFHNI